MRKQLSWKTKERLLNLRDLGWFRTFMAVLVLVFVGLATYFPVMGKMSEFGWLGWLFEAIPIVAGLIAATFAVFGDDLIPE